MLQVGQRLDDYKIISYFAGGGMGEIYLAEEVSLGRQVIIKVIRPEAIKYPNSQEGGAKGNTTLPARSNSHSPS